MELGADIPCAAENPRSFTTPSSMRTSLTIFATFALAAAGVVMLPDTAAAQRRLHGIARLGLEYGGDKVLEFEYEDGTTPDVTAGGGLVLTIGGGMQVAAMGRHMLDAQVNAGLKWRTIPAATNQDANWLRFPVEGLLFYSLPSGFRFGAGPTVHLANALRMSGSVVDENVDVQTTPGFLVQAEYVRRNLAFDVRYTALEYKLESNGGTIDASSIGIGMSFLFGRSGTATPASTPGNQSGHQQR